MAWELRRNRQYYYHKQRVDGQVTSTYFGQGPSAQATGILAGRERHQRTIARLDLAQLVREQRRIDREIDYYHRQVADIVAEMLQLLGYHQHKRQWRLKRMTPDLAGLRPAGDGAAPAKGHQKEAATAEYIELMRAAEKHPKGAQGAAAVERLREFAIAHPSLFEGASMLASTTRSVIINSCSQSETTRIHLEGEARALRRRLGIATATPLERLLIEEVVNCWLRMHMVEQLYSEKLAKGVPTASADYLERKLSATHKRYWQSIESLARVRRLLERAGVQVNIAQNQVVQNG